MNEKRLNIDGARLAAQIATLATFSDARAPAVTRVLYSAIDMAARAWLKERCAEAGLTVREDALGNTFARLSGTEENAAPVGTGSHIDAIPFSGRFDGTVGVLGALEALRAIQTAGIRPRRALELLLFTAEEPTRYGIGCLGSRALGGSISAEAIRALRDEAGEDVETSRARCGFSGTVESVRLEPNHYHAFVELHIEQGPRLEAGGVDIGNVTAIAAPATLQITIEGQGGHAGAVLMADRHDALVAGAELALAVEAAARESGAPDTVGTVGIFDIHPRAVNSIPSRVELTADVRDTELTRRDYAVERIRSAAAAIAAARGVQISIRTVNADPPAICAPLVREAIVAAARDHQLSCTDLVSRAYHDTLFMARVCPVGMIFIPCRGGVSHRPDEYASEEDIANGVRVLANTLARLAS